MGQSFKRDGKVIDFDAARKRQKLLRSKSGKNRSAAGKVSGKAVIYRWVVFLLFLFLLSLAMNRCNETIFQY